jgi:hypothetical protein
MWECHHCWEKNDDSVEHCTGCGLSKAASIKARRKAEPGSWRVLVNKILVFLLVGTVVAIFMPGIFQEWILKEVGEKLVASLLLGDWLPVCLRSIRSCGDDNPPCYKTFVGRLRQRSVNYIIPLSRHS